MTQELVNRLLEALKPFAAAIARDSECLSGWRFGVTPKREDYVRANEAIEAAAALSAQPVQPVADRITPSGLSMMNGAIFASFDSDEEAQIAYDAIEEGIPFATPVQPHAAVAVEEIANIIDPHSFMPDNSGDDLIAEMVKQGRDLALSKAARILSTLSAPPVANTEPVSAEVEGLCETIADARKTVTRWAGSAFIAGDELGPEAMTEDEHKNALYADLCVLMNVLQYIEDEAAATIRALAAENGRLKSERDEFIDAAMSRAHTLAEGEG